jgi:hypothetical protein
MLDAGSALFERLDAALLRMRKLRCEDFERRPGDAATDLPITVVHVEIHIVGHELVVARVDCGRQWHGSLARLRRCSPEDYSVAPFAEELLSCPQSSRNRVVGDHILSRGIVTDSQRQKALWLTGFGKSGFGSKVAQAALP